VRTAADAKRTACRADRRSQACADARQALRTTLRTLAPQYRAAKDAFRGAIRPAAQARQATVRAAKDAFRAAVRQALGA
jgi:hypothetical protein